MLQFIIVGCQFYILSKMNNCHQLLELEPLNAKSYADPEVGGGGVEEGPDTS